MENRCTKIKTTHRRTTCEFPTFNWIVRPKKRNHPREY